jgi:hypothetical protein
MLDNSVLLSESDIICTMVDDVSHQIPKFFIAEAIREAYPGSVAHKKKLGPSSRPSSGRFARVR